MALRVEEPNKGPALVVAPHNDDEVLSAAGAIQRHLAQDDAVTVALVTNGDGQYRGPFQDARLAIRYGSRRQAETTDALAYLGLAASNVVFLGFPDRGLASLWNRHWEESTLYRSPQTRAERSPYPNSYSESVPYCGRALRDDLERLIRHTQPRTIYLPHPNDLHHDHWSTNAFVVHALERLRRSGVLRPDSDGGPDLWTYVVHRGRWPLPRGRYPDAELAPPRPLANLDTDWFAVPLTPTEVRHKLEAIRRHRSQMRYMRRYLESFARRNELFGCVPPLTFAQEVEAADTDDAAIADLPPETDTPNGPTDALPPEIGYLDPRRRNILRDLRRFNDIERIRLRREPDDRLTIEVGFHGRLRRHQAILLHIKTTGEDSGSSETWRFVQSAGGLQLNNEAVRDPDIRHEARNRTLRISLPQARLSHPRTFLVGVELMRRGVTFAKSAYRLVRMIDPP